MIKIEDYKLLLKLNEIGTIRGTAKEILISQPAVSQRLKFIEEYFSETIFIRTPKQLVLTPSGEIILQHAKRIVQAEQAVKNKLAQSSSDVRGTLSIACSSLISQRFLPQILSEYTTAFPNVSIDLVAGISETIKRDHKNYHVCIIRGERLKDSECVQLFADPLYMFDTEEFPQHQIKKRPLISFKSDDSMHDIVDHWLYHQNNIKPIKAINVDQIETCKQFMMQGLGMAVLPKSVSNDLMDQYPNISLKLNGTYVTRDTWVCYQEGIRKLPQVDEFIKLLINRTYI